MQVMGQRVEHACALRAARAHQRNLAGKVDALFDDAFAVALGRQTMFFAGTDAPLAAAVVTAGAAFDDRQFAQAGEDARPFLL